MGCSITHARGALAADDDYFIALLPNGKWGVYFVTTGTATVAVTETIRQLATSETPDTAMIASLAEGALSVLGFPPFKEDGIEI